MRPKSERRRFEVDTFHLALCNMAAAKAIAKARTNLSAVRGDEIEGDHRKRPVGRMAIVGKRDRPVVLRESTQGLCVWR